MPGDSGGEGGGEGDGGGLGGGGDCGGDDGDAEGGDEGNEGADVAAAKEKVGETVAAKEEVGRAAERGAWGEAARAVAATAAPGRRRPGRRRHRALEVLEHCVEAQPSDAVLVGDQLVDAGPLVRDGEREALGLSPGGAVNR